MHFRKHHLVASSFLISRRFITPGKVPGIFHGLLPFRAGAAVLRQHAMSFHFRPALISSTVSSFLRDPDQGMYVRFTL